jgi:peptidoglycan/xylan/chitin deacetylase (PgdA/CDA1 family)
MPITMPDGKTHAVCLTFDFDGLSSWFATQGVFTPQAVSRGEYSARVAVERLLSLLADHDLVSTWFIPGHTADTWPAVTKAIADAGHEIGHHNYCHENPVGLDRSAEAEIIDRGIESLVNVTGQRPLGYRSPIWDLSEYTIELLLERGFVYGANGMADDYRPYRARVGDVASMTEPFRFGRETELIEIPQAWHLSDLIQTEIIFTWPNRTSVSLSEVERMWRDEFEFMVQRCPNGVLTYTFHPDGIGRAPRFLILERLLRRMKEYPGVWFPRMIDVARNWQPDPPGLWEQGIQRAA